jgi:multidrug efflux pump subunit AcrB
MSAAMMTTIALIAGMIPVALGHGEGASAAAASAE